MISRSGLRACGDDRSVDGPILVACFSVLLLINAPTVRTSSFGIVANSMQTDAPHLRALKPCVRVDSAGISGIEG
jgi:hypothetical protein